MTIAELYTMLSEIGLPLRYSDFVTDDGYPAPVPPYLVYLFAYGSDLMADNHNYKSVENYQIELYTDKKDLASEKLVEDKLKENEMPYSKIETKIESEDLYQIIYEVQII